MAGLPTFFTFISTATIGMCSTSQTARSPSGFSRCCMTPCCGPNTGTRRNNRARELPMQNNQRTSLVLQCAAASLLVLSLSACESLRNFVAGKEPPDEFAVVTKAPLIIPPDYNLKPPKPGVAPLNQVSPTQSAEAALYSEDPKTVAGTIGGTYSAAEKMLPAQAGAASASDSIRQQIAADNSNQQSADESFTNQLLFGSST